MKGKVSFKSQEEFTEWLGAMEQTYALQNVNSDVAQSPTEYPVVAVFSIEESRIDITYISQSDFIT
jgi:hypothetical protein